MRAAELPALPFQLGSALRRRRVFHPLGVVATGHVERVAADDVGLPLRSSPVLGRVSKAIGVPSGLPDLAGLAWRLPAEDAAHTPWDVLTVSAGAGVLTRFALRPAASWTGTTFSTLMPLRRRDGWWWIAAHLITPIDGGLSLNSIRDAIDDRGVMFRLEQARGSGPFEHLADLMLTVAVRTDSDHDVSFDPPRNTAAGVELGPGWVTALRERAYWRSRRGRHAPDDPTLNTTGTTPVADDICFRPRRTSE